ncbi:MAG: magnesium transporter [Trueperaceae bacterium]|nr:MAG: magnesium transporter [Trueperaceae bacterium]
MNLIGELARTLIETHPSDTARVLERFEPKETWDELTELDLEAQAGIVEAFSPAYGARLLLELPVETRTDLIRELSSETAADILEYLPEEDRSSLLSSLSHLHAEELETLFEYDEGTAGSIMSPEFVALRQDATVANALRRLRRMAILGKPSTYIYVIDEERVLTGVLLLRDLALARPENPLHDVMIADVVRALVDEELTGVARRLREHNLLAVPITDATGRLVGVVSATQLVSELQEEGFEDAQKMFGAGSDEHASSTARFTIGKRLPWLSINLATAFLAAGVIRVFDPLIAQVTILAAFLPVVAGQSGNAGAQALAVMLRSLALEEIDPRRPRKVILKESFVGFVNGLATGLLAGTFSAWISGSTVLGGVVAVAMTINLTIAGVAGALIPIVMERLGRDPAQSSNIILTTVTDVFGFATFLGLALLARPL